MICSCFSLTVSAQSRVLPPVVDNSTYSGGSSYTSSAPSANAMYEVLGRLEQLQHEIQQLRGVVEEQSQTIADLKKRQGNIYSDLDSRLHELTGGDGSTVKPAFVSMNASGQSEVVKPTTISSGKNVGGYSVSESGNSIATNDSVNKPKKNQKALYQSAYETLRNGHNTRAIVEFKALLSEFPKGEYADNSQYWLGEAYKANQDINSAKGAFSKVVKDFPNSPKVPGALLKLGYIEFDQNNIPKARDYLTQVTVNYPDSTAAHLAAKKLTKMGVIHP